MTPLRPHRPEDVGAVTPEFLAKVKESLEAQGYVVLKAASYRREQEKRRIAQALLACQEEHNESTRQWGVMAYDEQRRLTDRLVFVYGVARAHGATEEELSGP
jgi:hypothetical protein